LEVSWGGERRGRGGEEGGKVGERKEVRWWRGRRGSGGGEGGEVRRWGRREKK